MSFNPNTPRLSKPEYGCYLALSARSRSEDPHTQVGVALFDEEWRTVSTGFNGFGPGFLPKETVVPNRNKIFSSLIQAVALSLATKPVGEDCNVRQDVKIALGIHAGDHAIYPDCRQEFRDADMEAFRIGNWDSELVSFYTPYLEMNKYDILVDGEDCCEELGLDFNEVYKRTNTSYKPIKHYYRPETYAFKWYSDYKSAASVERIEAFIKLDRPDPVEYADETGPVSWEVARAHVEQVLAEHKKANI